MAEDVDAEMEDVVVLPPLPESQSVLAVEQVFGDGDRMDVRENSASPVPGPARTSPGSYPEGDVEGESGASDGSGHAGDAGVHGKRKR